MGRQDLIFSMGLQNNFQPDRMMDFLQGEYNTEYRDPYQILELVKDTISNNIYWELIKVILWGEQTIL